MSKQTVSRKTAEAVLADLKTWAPQYAEHAASGPNLRDNDHEELPEGCWSIDWEEGPYEWTYDYSLQAAGAHPGLLLEPINGCILGVYPV